MIEALAGGSGDGKQERAADYDSPGNAIKVECHRIRETLEVNHVIYDRADVSGLHQQLLKPHSSARENPRGAGFHRLLVLDAECGKGPRGEFDLQYFLQYVHDQFVKIFRLHLAEDTFHLENISQVLKDEPRSLFCFLNLQCVPIAALRRLRGFTQELHQGLFVFCGDRDLKAEELPYQEFDADSGISGVGVS